MTKLIFNIIQELDDRHIPVDKMQIIHKILNKRIYNYEFVVKNRDLVVQNANIPSEVKMFILAKKLEGCSQETLTRYTTYLTRFFNYVQQPIKNITAMHVKFYLFTIEEQNSVSKYTVNVYRRVIQSFFTWCYNEHIIDSNPLKNLSKIKYSTKSVQPLTESELELIRNACVTLREKALFEILYSTGCKVKEIINMNIDDVNFDKQTIDVKNGKSSRTVYMNSLSVLMLKNYLSLRNDDNKALFVHNNKPYCRLKNDGIEKIISKLGKKAGLKRNIFPQLIRHTTATLALQRGMKISNISTILGHKDIISTTKYAHNNSQQYEHSKCF